MKKIIIIIFIFLLTGCFNYTELNKMAIVSSIGIDKENDNYVVTVQIMNAKESDETEGSQVSVYTEKGKTILYALTQSSGPSPPPPCAPILETNSLSLVGSVVKSIYSFLFW